jgi:hypothetical protein
MTDSLGRLATEVGQQGDKLDKAVRDLTGLQGTVDGLFDRVTDVLERYDVADERLEGLTTAVELVVAELKAKRDDPSKAQWCWPRMTQDQAKKAWRILVPWVENIIRGPMADDAGEYDDDRHYRYTMYEGANSVDVANCWFAHPDVVDDLSANHFAWRAAYGPNPGATAAAEWIDRWLPHTLQRAKRVGSNCRNGCKILKKSPSHVTDEDRRKFIDKDVADRRSEPLEAAD